MPINYCICKSLSPLFSLSFHSSSSLFLSKQHSFLISFIFSVFASSVVILLWIFPKGRVLLSLLLCNLSFPSYDIIFSWSHFASRLFPASLPAIPSSSSLPLVPFTFPPALSLPSPPMYSTLPAWWHNHYPARSTCCNLPAYNNPAVQSLSSPIIHTPTWQPPPQGIPTATATTSVLLSLSFSANAGFAGGTDTNVARLIVAILRLTITTITGRSRLQE